MGANTSSTADTRVVIGIVVIGVVIAVAVSLWCVLRRLRWKRKQKMVRDWRQMQREVSIQSEVRRVEANNKELSVVAKEAEVRAAAQYDPQPSTSAQVVTDLPPNYEQIVI